MKQTYNNNNNNNNNDYNNDNNDLEHVCQPGLGGTQTHGHASGLRVESFGLKLRAQQFVFALLMFLTLRAK